MASALSKLVRSVSFSRLVSRSNLICGISESPPSFLIFIPLNEKWLFGGTALGSTVGYGVIIFISAVGGASRSMV